MPNPLFWQKDSNLRLLRELTFYYLYKTSPHAGGKDLMELVQEIERFIPPPSPDRNALYTALRRFIFFEVSTPQVAVLHEALFHLVMSWFRQHMAHGETKRTKYLQKLALKGWFDLLERRASESETPDISPPDQFDMASSAVEMFKSFFSTTDREFEQAARGLTGRERCRGSAPTDDDRQGFTTYRYSSRAGAVVKTFTLVTPPCDTYPYCSFRNFYVNDESQVTKDSRGVVVQLHHAIYFLGRINDGEAIKMFILPSAVANAGIIPGLVASVTDNGDPLIGRAVFVRTTARHTKDCVPEVIPREKAHEIVPANILRRIRNYTDFYMPHPIFFEDDKAPISVPRMVELVAKYCADHFSIDGEPFNPAAHSHYPFNQAIMAYSADEK